MPGGASRPNPNLDRARGSAIRFLQHIAQLMKTFLHLAAILVAMTLSTFAADKPSASKKLYHVVSFKFKADAKKEQIDGVVAAFRDLKKKIPAIQEFSWGTNVSP